MSTKYAMIIPVVRVSYGSDQADDGELGEAVDVLNLGALDPQTSRFQRTEPLLDEPPHAGPGDNLTGLLQRRHRVRGHGGPTRQQIVDLALAIAHHGDHGR